MTCTGAGGTVSASTTVSINTPVSSLIPQQQAVYLSYAANCDRPLSSRLHVLHPPILRSSLEVSGLRAARSASSRAHLPPCHLTIVRLNSRLQRLGLRPRRHAEQEHLTQAPHPLRQPGRHRRGTRLPLLG